MISLQIGVFAEFWGGAVGAMTLKGGMAMEIERKFLVIGEPPLFGGVEMVQAYLSKVPGCTVRVRKEGDRAVLTVKGMTVGISRKEFEYEIPYADAQEIIDMAEGGTVEKTRYYHRCGEHLWEIDVFKGANAGLVVAEIELTSEDEEFTKPVWVGEEVTGDRRYANSSLLAVPFCDW